MLFNACDTRTFSEIDGAQLTPAIPVTQVLSTAKSEGKTKNLIFENSVQSIKSTIICSLFSSGIVMPGVFSWQSRRQW